MLRELERNDVTVSFSTNGVRITDRLLEGLKSLGNLHGVKRVDRLARSRPLSPAAGRGRRESAQGLAAVVPGAAPSGPGYRFEQSFDDIWSGVKFRQFRADLCSGDAIPAICRDCTAVRMLGPHPMRFSAEIVHGRSQLCGSSGLRLVVRNNGGAAWNSDQPIALGRVGDVPSSLWTPSWQSRNRIFRQDSGEIPPGGKISIEFEIASEQQRIAETFALVVEGRTWLDGTAITLPL